MSLMMRARWRTIRKPSGLRSRVASTRFAFPAAAEVVPSFRRAESVGMAYASANG